MFVALFQVDVSLKWSSKGVEAAEHANLKERKSEVGILFWK